MQIYNHYLLISKRDTINLRKHGIFNNICHTHFIIRTS